MKEFICTVCPRGCRLKVDEVTLNVTGNSCPKGTEYGKNEATNPLRILTSTVLIEGAIHRRLPVRTDKPIPKDKLFDCMKTIHTYKEKSPVKAGQILIKDLAGTGANLITSREM
ncbi:MAG: molybdopterin oxidoreductase [Clostridiales bacterium GWF2_36_10]|nr:MAG: molybdopterin oxidoreductase [Clostridiales bacterium GWF2_36_10]HAN21418.1 molybdopterin oxidoreductase [Clostridiales bacterium]